VGNISSPEKAAALVTQLEAPTGPAASGRRLSALDIVDYARALTGGRTFDAKRALTRARLFS
jgi:hypothetical protein